MRNRHLFFLVGAALGLLAPLARLLYRAYIARQAWWDKWLTTEFNKNWDVYLVIGLIGILALALLGYLIGSDRDRLWEESRNVKASNIELSQQAATDPLTGLCNPRAINERLGVEIENSGRSPVTCLVIDIDFFKRINDKNGHPFGDAVLVAVANTLKKCVRRIDTVGRLGGEEFIIILPGIAESEAMEVGERVRSAVENEHIAFDDKEITVTVSVGAATFPGHGLKQKESLIQAADAALYRAKRAGRNRVVLWEAA